MFVTLLILATLLTLNALGLVSQDTMRTLFAAIVSTGLAMLVALSFRPIRPETMARAVDDHFELSDLMISSWELTRENSVGKNSGWLPMVLERCQEKLTTLPLREAIRKINWRWAWAALGALLLCFAVGFLARQGVLKPRPAIQVVQIPPGLPGDSATAAGGPLEPFEELAPEEVIYESAATRQAGRQLSAEELDALLESTGEAGTQEGTLPDLDDAEPGEPGAEANDTNTQDGETQSDPQLLEEVKRDLESTAQSSDQPLGDESGEQGENGEPSGPQAQGSEDQNADPNAQQVQGDQAGEGQQGEAMQKGGSEGQEGEQNPMMAEGAAMSGEGQMQEGEMQEGAGMGDGTGPQAGLAQVLAEEMTELEQALGLEQALIEGTEAPAQLADETEQKASPRQEATLERRRVRGTNANSRATPNTARPVPLSQRPGVRSFFRPDPPKEEAAKNPPEGQPQQDNSTDNDSKNPPENQP